MNVKPEHTEEPSVKPSDVRIPSNVSGSDKSEQKEGNKIQFIKSDKTLKPNKDG